MPIYEYECRDCGHRFEYLVRSTSPAAECPSCQKQNLKQLISLSAVSSEGTREASFRSARKSTAGVRKEKQHEEHKGLHQHFED
jgi:putative FmdB family regulatory protein